MATRFPSDSQQRDPFTIVFRIGKALWFLKGPYSETLVTDFAKLNQISPCVSFEYLRRKFLLPPIGPINWFQLLDPINPASIKDIEEQLNDSPFSIDANKLNDVYAYFYYWKIKILKINLDEVRKDNEEKYYNIVNLDVYNLITRNYEKRELSDKFGFKRKFHDFLYTNLTRIPELVSPQRFLRIANQGYTTIDQDDIQDTKWIVKISTNHRAEWEEVFLPLFLISTDTTLNQPVATIDDTDYVVYFVTFNPKKVFNPDEIDAVELENKNHFVVQENEELRLFACYLCKKLLYTNIDSTLCQCFCGTYPADGGYEYFVDSQNANSKTKSIEYEGTVSDYRVILVGASGKGKSTLINGMASYSTHKTLDDAVQSELKPIIPINFRLVKNFKQYAVSIETGTPDDDNEDFSGGGVRSTTQKPKRHLFNLPESDHEKLTFIDTPGINDTRGHEMDDRNIEYIKQALIEAEYIHAICFVLSANDIKMITSYETVLRRLLSLVPRDALKNVVFFFNSTRGTNYGIGDSIEPLTCVFKNLARHGFNVHFVDENVFFFENDCFRYLCAAKCGHAYAQNISVQEFEDSWIVNRNSYYKFVGYLHTLQPVNGASFDQLDTAYMWIVKLEEAVAWVSFNDKNNDQISRLLEVLKQQKSLSVDEQLVIFNQVDWLLKEHVSPELSKSIQKYKQLRLAETIKS